MEFPNLHQKQILFMASVLKGIPSLTVTTEAAAAASPPTANISYNGAVKAYNELSAADSNSAVQFQEMVLNLPVSDLLNVRSYLLDLYLEADVGESGSRPDVDVEGILNMARSLKGINGSGTTEAADESPFETALLAYNELSDDNIGRFETIVGGLSQDDRGELASFLKHLHHDELARKHGHPNPGRADDSGGVVKGFGQWTREAVTKVMKEKFYAAVGSVMMAAWMVIKPFFSKETVMGMVVCGKMVYEYVYCDLFGISEGTLNKWAIYELAALVLCTLMTIVGKPRLSNILYISGGVLMLSSSLARLIVTFHDSSRHCSATACM